MVGVGRSDSDGGPAGSTAAADYAQTNNTAGIIAMLAAMASFACGDSLMKLSSTDLPTGELVWLRATLAPGDLHVGGRFDLRRPQRSRPQCLDAACQADASPRHR